MTDERIVDAASLHGLAGSQWRLVEGLDGIDAAEVEVTLAFGQPGADGALPLNGNGGCNRYSSQLSLDGARVAVAPVVATKRGCMPPAGEAEQQWFDALSDIAALARDGDALVLTTASGGTFRLVR